MNRSLEISMGVTLNGYGFSLEGRRINSGEIRRFLIEIFDYWDDEVEHSPIFDYIGV